MAGPPEPIGMTTMSKPMAADQFFWFLGKVGVNQREEARRISAFGPETCVYELGMWFPNREL